MPNARPVAPRAAIATKERLSISVRLRMVIRSAGLTGCLRKLRPDLFHFGFERCLVAVVPDDPRRFAFVPGFRQLHARSIADRSLGHAIASHDARDANGLGSRHRDDYVAIAVKTR